MFRILAFLFLIFTNITISIASQPIDTKQIVEQEMTPTYLYKILSVEDWKKSQHLATLKLSSADNEFIHLSKVDQLEKIKLKYWSDVPKFVVLKLRTDKLMGRLIYETNPGGSNKFYHLYDGCIPLDAVEEAKIVKGLK